MSSLAKHILFAKRLVAVMDIRFSIFGVKFGIDPLLNIIPGFGNYVATATSFYLFYLAFRLKVPAFVYVKMAFNIGVDYVFGVIPFIGIFIDVFFRSNMKNFALLVKYYDPDILIGEEVRI